MDNPDAEAAEDGYVPVLRVPSKSDARSLFSRTELDKLASSTTYTIDKHRRVSTPTNIDTSSDEPRNYRNHTSNLESQQSTGGSSKRDVFLAKREINRASLASVSHPGDTRRSFLKDSTAQLTDMDASLKNEAKHAEIKRKNDTLSSSLKPTTEQKQKQHQVDSLEPPRGKVPEFKDSDPEAGIPVMDALQKHMLETVLRDEPHNFDCGEPNSAMSQSRRRAHLQRKAKHLGFFGLDAAKHFYPLNSSFGHFQWPFCSSSFQISSWLGGVAEIEVPLAVSFHFKLMKAYATLLFILALITLPSIILLSQASRSSQFEAAYLHNTASLTPLATVTLASVDLPKHSCREADDGETLTFRCPSGHVIGDVSAKYGTPSRCVYSESQYGGSTQMSAGCNSDSAAAIVKYICTGKQQCSLLVGSQSFNITVDAALSNICNPRIDPGSICFTNLNRGSFTSCGETKRLSFEATCNIKHYDNNGLSRSRLISIVASLNAVAVLVLLVGTLWIRREMKEEIFYCEGTTSRPSDYSVEVDLPTSPYLDLKLSRDELIPWIENTLSKADPIAVPGPITIADVAFSTSSIEYIEASIKRGQYAKQIDIEIAYYLSWLRSRKNGKSSLSGWKRRFKSVLYNYAKCNELCEQLQSSALSKISTAYITFSTEEGCDRCLSYFPSIESSILTKPIKLEARSSREIFVKRAPNPSDIKWENCGISFLSRLRCVMLTTVFLLILLSLSYIGLWFVKYETSKRILSGISCDRYTVSLSEELESTASITTSKAVKDYFEIHPKNYMKCFCEEVYRSSGLNGMMSYDFIDPRSGDKFTPCRTLFNNEYQYAYQSYYITFVALLTNGIALFFVPKMVKFERWGYHIKDSISIFLKAFFFQYINVGILILSIFGKHKRTFLANNNAVVEEGLYGTFNDFNRDWYICVGSSLMFTLFIYPITNRLLLAWNPTVLLLRRIFDMRNNCSSLNPLFSVSFTHTAVQADLDALYVGDEFPVEIQYASVVAAICIALTFSAGIPPLYMICSFILTFFFFFDKYFLLRLNKSPRNCPTEIPRIAVNLILLSIVVHCIFAIWFYGKVAEPYDASDQTFIHANLMFDGNCVVFTIGALFLSIFIVFTWPLHLLRLFLMEYFQCFRSTDKSMQRSAAYRTMFNVEENKSSQRNQHSYLSAIPLEVLKWRCSTGAVFSPILEDYKRQIIAYADGAKPPDRQMLELESYNIHASKDYLNKFGLETCFMKRHRPRDWMVDIPFFYIPDDDVASYVSSSTRASLPARSFLGADDDHLPSLQQHIDDNYDYFKDDINDMMRLCAPKRDDYGKHLKFQYSYFPNFRSQS